MIPRSAVITMQKLDPHALTILDSDHAEPVDSWAVCHYERLLTERPDEDTDPILVIQDEQGRSRVRRGRHRVLANRNVNRPYVLAMVYPEELP
jgi:hypothetical protein